MFKIRSAEVVHAASVQPRRDTVDFTISKLGVVEWFADITIAHTRALSPLGLFAARVVRLLRIFHVRCDVNVFQDADWLPLLLLWMHLLLQPLPSLHESAEAVGATASYDGGQRALPAVQMTRTDEESNSAEQHRHVLAATCGDIYPLAAPALNRWLQEYQLQRLQQPQQLQPLLMLPSSPPPLHLQQQQQQNDRAVAESISPAVLFFHLLLVVVQVSRMQSMSEDKHSRPASNIMVICDLVIT